MKKRKILLLIPFAGLILSGCTFQDGLSWVGEHIYTPVKDWIVNLFNPGKKDEKKEEGGGGGGGEDKPTEDQPEHAGTLADPFTGKDACIVAQKLAQGASTTERYYIQGEVQEIAEYNASYGNFTFYIEDGFECYRCLKGEARAKYKSEDDLKVGDTVLVNAQLRKWYETSETEDGYIAKINGVDQVPEETTEPDKINATLAEILATEGSKSQAYVSSAQIKFFADNKGAEVTTPSEYGNMVLTDGEHDIFVYGSSAVATDLAWDAANGEYKFTNSKAFNTNELTKNLKKGDTINFWGIYFVYNGTTPEMNIIITGTEAVPVSSVSFGQIADPIEMELGKASAQVQLEAQVLPANASDKGLVWTSGDDSIATVENGLVTAHAEGSTTITATAHDGSGKYATANVHVTESSAELESITLEATGTVKTAYSSGEGFSSDGLTVIAHYSEGDPESVSTGVTWSYEINDVEVSSAAVAHDGATLKIIAHYEQLTAEYEVQISVAEQKGTATNPYTVAEARAAIDAGTGVTNVYAKGIVTSIPYPYSSQNKNISFFFSDDGTTNNEIEAYMLSADTDPNVEIGDTVTVYGSLLKYNSTYEFGKGCTLIEDVKPTVVSLEITGTATKTEYSVGQTYNHNGLVASATFDNGLVKDVSNSATWVISPETATLGDTEITISCTYNQIPATPVVVGVTVTDSPTPQEDATASKTIAEIATANSWANSTRYPSFSLDENVTVAITEGGTGNSGKYYTSGNQWRLYQTESPKVTISPGSGYTIKTAKITYSIDKTGVMLVGETQVTSGTTINVNNSSLVIGVGNTGDATNGQVRITAIEIVYCAD